MKSVFTIVIQLVLFLAIFFCGLILTGLNILPTLSIPISPGRVFVYDGMLLMLAIYFFILLIEVLLKRIRSSWLNTTVALSIALILGLAMKFGFKSI